MLSPEDRAFLTEAFATLEDEVTITLVRKAPSRIILLDKSSDEGDNGEVVAKVLGEVAAVSPKLKLVEVDAAVEPDRAAELAGDHLPVTLLSSATTKGRLRFIGVPAGHEMATLISTLVDLGMTPEPIPAEIEARLLALKDKVTLQVFVTPSCPHCPQMARAAFQLARYFPNISADVIEIQEFPELAQKYQVRGVPKTLINEKEELLGAVPGGILIQAIETAVSTPPAEPSQLIIP